MGGKLENGVSASDDPDDGPELDDDVFDRAQITDGGQVIHHVGPSLGPPPHPWNIHSCPSAPT